MHVLKVALEFTKAGKAHYEELARQASVTGIGNIFGMLADGQQELYDRLAVIPENPDARPDVSSEVLDGRGSVFGKIFTADEATVKALTNDREAYRYALAVQGRTVVLFRDMAGKEKNEDAKAILQKVVAEEERLYNEVQDIYEFVAAPTWHPTAIEYSMAIDRRGDASGI